MCSMDMSEVVFYAIVFLCVVYAYGEHTAPYSMFLFAYLSVFLTLKNDISIEIVNNSSVLSEPRCTALPVCLSPSLRSSM